MATKPDHVDATPAVQESNQGKLDGADKQHSLIDTIYDNTLGRLFSTKTDSLSAPASADKAMSNFNQLIMGAVPLKQGDANHDSRLTLKELNDKQAALVANRVIQQEMHQPTPLDNLNTYGFMIKHFKELAGTPYSERRVVIENVNPADISDPKLSEAFKKVADDYKGTEKGSDLRPENLTERTKHFEKMIDILKESRYDLVNGRVEAATSLADKFGSLLSEQQLMSPNSSFVADSKTGELGLLPSLAKQKHEQLVKSGADPEQIKKSAEMLDTLNYLSGTIPGKDSPVSLKEIESYKDNQSRQLKGVVELDTQRAAERVKFQNMLADYKLVHENFDAIAILSNPDKSLGISADDIMKQLDKQVYQTLLLGMLEAGKEGHLAKPVKDFLSRHANSHLGKDEASFKTLELKINTDLGPKSPLKIQINKAQEEAGGYVISIVGSSDQKTKDKFVIKN